MFFHPQMTGIENKLNKLFELHIASRSDFLAIPSTLPSPARPYMVPCTVDEPQCSEQSRNQQSLPAPSESRQQCKVTFEKDIQPSVEVNRTTPPINPPASDTDLILSLVEEDLQNLDYSIWGFRIMAFTFYPVLSKQWSIFFTLNRWTPHAGWHLSLFLCFYLIACSVFFH